MGRLVIYTVILAIISIGCGSETKKVEKKTDPNETHGSSELSLYSFEDEYCVVDFPGEYKTDTIRTSDFMRITHVFDTDSLDIAIEEIDYLTSKPQLNDSLYQRIHEGSVNSLINTSRLVKVDFSEAQNSSKSVGKINGHDKNGNYTFLRYQVREEGIIQIGIWTDSTHVALGEDVLNALKFK